MPRSSHAAVTAALLAGLCACSSGQGPSGAASATSAAPSAISAAPSAGATGKPSFGPVPSQARRSSPPPGIAERAAAEGAKAPLFSLPDFSLPGSSGAPFSLEQALSKTKYVVLVFYRGAW